MLSKFLSFKQKQIYVKTFAESHFGYYSLIWIFHNRKLNRKINHIQERYLQIFCNDCTISFKDLLKKDNSFKIHHKNIQSLATELFKVIKGVANPIYLIFFH